MLHSKTVTVVPNLKPRMWNLVGFVLNKTCDGKIQRTMNVSLDVYATKGQVGLLLPRYDPTRPLALVV